MDFRMLQLLFSPVAVAASILSLKKEDVIPFIPPKFLSFVVLTLSFGLLGVVLQVAQRCRLWRWQVLVTTASQNRLDMKTKWARLNLLRFPPRMKSIQQDVENGPKLPMLRPYDPAENSLPIL